MSAAWDVIPREADLTRLHDPISGWTKLTLVERLNTNDTWVVEGPASALSVFGPGSGCILDRDGEQVASGIVTNVHRIARDEDGRPIDNLVVTFASDLFRLGGRVVLPSRTTVIGPTIGTFPAAYDTQTGAVETLILYYLRATLADLALTDRRLERLWLPATQGRGGSTQVTGRLDNVGVLVQSLAEAGNLRVTIGHAEQVTGPWLNLAITAARDLSDDVRFGSAESTAAGIVSGFEYELGIPTTTRALVAGGGDLAERIFLQVRDTAAEELWNHVAETVVDQRQVEPGSADAAAEMTRAGAEALASGAGPVSVSFTPVLGPDLAYRRDFVVGDIVGYDLPGLDPASEKVRQVTTTVQAGSSGPTESIDLVVGTPDAPTKRTQAQAAKALRAVTAIQRSK